MATAFAVFCATDGSLIFYNRDTVPAVGDTFEGKVVSNVYTGFDTRSYSNSSQLPWYNEMLNIVSVSFVPEFATVRPYGTAYWFYGAINMTSFNGTNLNTTRSGSMYGMFRDCSSLVYLNIKSLNTSAVTTLSAMFHGCTALSTIDVSNFDTSNVTNMHNMFHGCTALTSIDVSNFDTSNVTNMGYMFRDCETLSTIDVSNFDTSSATNISGMFWGCRALTTIYASERWSIVSVADSSYMFNQCVVLVGVVPYDNMKSDASMANYETGYFTYKRCVKPEDMLIKNTTLYSIADEIRILYGTEETMTPAVMNSNLNTFNTELSAINVEQDGLIEQLKNLFGAEFPEADTLDGCSWENISKVAEKGLASNFWSVGDTKKVVLNGTVGTLSLDNFETYVYIIGFDHNGATNTIDFGTFKTADGVDVALNVNFLSGKTDGTLNFGMNHWGSYNYGGWAGCDLRYDILGSTDVAPSGYGAAVASGRIGYDANSTCATNPVANTLMAALPSELRAIMKPMTIYTDNVGGGTDVESNVTTTIDYLPLLSEFEIDGKRTYANNYEQSYQVQYAYYANGNSKIKYKHNSISSAVTHWTRSAHSLLSTDYFCLCRQDGSAGSAIASRSDGLAPIFRV